MIKIPYKESLFSNMEHFVHDLMNAKIHMLDPTSPGNIEYDALGQRTSNSIFLP